MGGYDLFVLPAGLFIDLSPGLRPWPAIAYGEGLDAAPAFDAGALDYLRNRWPAEELYARAARLMRPKFSFRGAGAVLEGKTLALAQPGAASPRCLALSPGDSRILRILAAAKGSMVPRHALMGEGLSRKALSMRISRLRKTLDEFSPGLGECIAGTGGGYVFLP
jgi:DNA-binding response OmpR family regulator